MSKLKLSGVSKAYGATVALSRGDLEIEAAQRLVGPVAHADSACGDG